MAGCHDTCRRLPLSKEKKLMRLARFAIVPGLIAVLAGPAALRAEVKPGDVVTAQNASKVQGLVSPGNYILVQQGMEMDIIPSEKLEWPPPYTAATEKYQAQVRLMPDG